MRYEADFETEQKIKDSPKNGIFSGYLRLNVNIGQNVFELNIGQDDICPCDSLARFTNNFAIFHSQIVNLNVTCNISHSS